MRLALIIVCLAVTVAHADPAPAASEEKSPGTAVFLSVAIPVAGVVTMGASHGNAGVFLLGTTALIFGPSTGRWYANESAVLGVGLRLVGTVAMGYGVAMVVNIGEADCVPNDSPCQSSTPYGLMALGGAGLFVGSTVYDIMQARRDAERYNERHVSVTPGLVGTTRAPGVFVTARF